MNKRKFVKFTLVYIFFITLFVISINFIVDPLYNWGVLKTFDFKKPDFDERIQKTNYLSNIDNNYDAVLIGNSRSTYLNTKDFDLGVRVFNYSVNAMSVYEYEQVLQNFIKLTGTTPKMVLIGVDPFNFSGQDIEMLRMALNSSRELSSRVKNLLSFDVLDFSVQTIIKTIYVELNKKDRKQRYYDNTLVKGNYSRNTISNEKYVKDFSSVQNMDYNILEEYKRLKEKYANIQFLVYCLPFHADLINDLEKNKDFKAEREKFILELVNIFGQVYYFNYINEYNSLYLDFYDSFHFYPYLGQIIIKNINNLSKNKKSEYGFLIDKSNYKIIIENINQVNYLVKGNL